MSTDVGFFEAVPTITPEASEVLKQLATESTYEKICGLGAIGLNDEEIGSIAETDGAALREGVIALTRRQMRLLGDSSYSVLTLLRRYGAIEETRECLRKPREALGGMTIIEGFATDPRTAARETMAVAIEMYREQAA